MKLISITEHSDYLETLNIRDSEKWKLHCLRKEFGKRSLELGMFIHCDLDGNVMEEPSEFASVGVFEYKEAQERVLFKGVKITKDKYKSTKRTFYYIKETRIAFELEYHTGEKEFNFAIKRNYLTIEGLVKLNLELTETAIKLLKI